MPESSSLPKKDLETMLLDTARKIIVEQGYQKLSMRKLAEEVGCVQGTIYLYFKNKQALVHAVVDEFLETLERECLRAILTKTDPLAQLEAMGQKYIELALEFRQHYEIAFMHHPLLHEGGTKDRFHKARKLLTVMAEILQRWQTHEDSPIEDPLAEATLLWANLHGILSLIISKRLFSTLNAQEMAEASLQHSLAGMVWKIQCQEDSLRRKYGAHH